MARMQDPPRIRIEQGDKIQKEQEGDKKNLMSNKMKKAIEESGREEFWREELERNIDGKRKKEEEPSRKLKGDVN